MRRGGVSGEGWGESVAIGVLALARRVEGELGEGLGELGLTVGRLGLLGHIGGGEGISFSELARRSGVSVQSAHAGVKGLVAAGLVRDRRGGGGAASAIELTDKGIRLLGEAREVVAKVDRRLFGVEADPVMRRMGAALRAAYRVMCRGEGRHSLQRG
ncbi:MarR family transcriptional regulator [Nocardia panacis]|uniref:MarR family transcriptional regulator n=1 Tax=Nocardia panacis TaxID=2340916 RepID=A0A3A4KKV3_9NOCA|nr:MarR family transcriptional regulator [Nocardia panacis]